MGVVLVGGRSQRMGTDKAQLPWGPEGTLLDRQVATLAAAGAREVCLAGRAGQNPPGPDRRWLPDHPAAEGPLAGLLAALSGLPAGLSHVWALAVDLPAVPPALFAAEPLRPRRGWIVRTAKGFEPLAACYPRGALAPMLALAKERIWRLQDHAARLCAEGLLTTREPPDLAWFANLNTPADLPPKA
jgi:molybdopterin-guanine dinucleotide biosynthesis protein A